MVIFNTTSNAGGWSVVSTVAAGDRQTHVTLTWAGAGPPIATDDLRKRYRLSPTQARVALMLYSRRTNAEIADVLGVRLNTVRSHVELTLLKLGVSSRVDVQRAVDGVAVRAGMAAATDMANIRRQPDAESAGRGE